MEWDILVDVFAVTSPLRMECVRVPAGEFLMGSALAKDREASKGELPQHRVYPAEFYIGKYPVTNAHAQRAAFVRSARYEALPMGKRAPQRFLKFDLSCQREKRRILT
jgi:formylglycine-generating enzyme required for sulfatase activity